MVWSMGGSRLVVAIALWTDWGDSHPSGMLSSISTSGVTTLQGRLILQVTWRRCSDPRDDTESCGLSVSLVRDVRLLTERDFLSCTECMPRD